MLFERQGYGNLLEQELLSEECQIFTEAFLDGRYTEIDYEIPILEVVALHDIVNKISALQEGILEEEIAVYADHETVDDYILSLMEFYDVEDPETLLETAQEVLNELGAVEFAKRNFGKIRGIFGKKKPVPVPEVPKTKLDAIKDTATGYVNTATEKLGSIKDNAVGYGKTAIEKLGSIKDSAVGHAKSVGNRINTTYQNTSKSVGEFAANNPKLIKGAKIGGGVGAVGGAGAAGYSAGSKAGVSAGNNAAGFNSGSASSVYDRVKGMGGDAKRAIMNNKGLALKTLGGAAAAGGLGYLAYKLWKNRNKKKAAAKA